MLYKSIERFLHDYNKKIPAPSLNVCSASAHGGPPRGWQGAGRRGPRGSRPWRSTRTAHPRDRSAPMAGGPSHSLVPRGVSFLKGLQERLGTRSGLSDKSTCWKIESALCKKGSLNFFSLSLRWSMILLCCGSRRGRLDRALSRRQAQRTHEPSLGKYARSRARVYKLRGTKQDSALACRRSV